MEVNPVKKIRQSFSKRKTKNSRSESNFYYRVNPDIFKDYDIRGIYPQEINEDTAYLIGRAFVKFLRKKNPRIVIGQDNRLSSSALFKSLTKGITDQGANVVNIGLSTTPLLYFAVAHFKYDGGIEISASIDRSEVVLVKDLNSQKQFLTETGDFIDQLLAKGESPQKFAVLSFDPQIGKVQFKLIKNVFRHLSKERLYELTLKYGRTIKVTKFHSVYTLKENKIVSIPTKNLKINDLIAVPNFIPNNSFIPSINLAKELYPFRKQLREILIAGSDVKKILLNKYFNQPRRKKRVSLIEEGRQILRQKRKEMRLSRRKAAEICNLSPMTIQRIELGKTRKFVKENYLRKYVKMLDFNPVENFLSRFVLEKKDFLGTWKGGSTLRYLKLNRISSTESQQINDCHLWGRGFPQYKIKNTINISPEFMRLIGYYLAEGNLENKIRVGFNLGPSFSGHEKFIIEDIIFSSKRVFGYSPKIYKYKSKTTVAIDNSVIYSLFAKILGFENKKSTSKELPNFVYTLPKSYKLELLKANFLGDGNIGSDGKNIRFNSSSKKLISGISYLLTQVGIIYSFFLYKSPKKNKSLMYNLIISNKEDLKKLKPIWEKHWKAEKIKLEYQRKPRKERIKRIKDLIFLPIKKIKKISTPKFVYDFSVDGETFIAGIGGICCHNSHNPAQYNGFKLVREKAVPISGESGIKEIKDIVLKGEFKGAKKGRIIKREFLKDYISFNLKGINLNKLKPVKIIIDTANAVPGILVPEIFKKIKCKIYHLFSELNGSFPNHPPDPLKKENLKTLCDAVKRKKADLGIAFDGDGDRIIFIDESGRIIPGDIITALIAKLILKERPGEKILYDVRSSNIVRETIEKAKGIPVVGRIGHSFIKEKMRNENIIFAGEFSGHYYHQNHYFFEYPIFILLKILEIISQTEKPLSQIIKPFQKYFHSGEINFKVKEKGKMLEKLEKKFGSGQILRIDGLRVDFKDWWFLVRPSNTEPVIRLVVEANTRKMMVEKVREMKSIIELP